MQKLAGARLQDTYGWSLPGSYSSLGEEYEAATQGVGLVDRSYVGRLRIGGKDGLDLLSRLSTNKLVDLTPGRGMTTVLTSNKGRVLDLLFVLRLEDHLLALTSPENRKKVADWIDFYTFTEDVTVKDVTEETAMLALVGPRAADALSELAGGGISSLARHESRSASLGGVEALVIRTDFVRLPGYDLVMAAPQARQLWEAMLASGQGIGVKPVGMDALEVVRVEQGVPLYGKDMSEDNNPLEAGLWDSISFDKGCYIGQEVVARLNTYKKVQRQLVGLSWDSDYVPASNTGLSLDGKQVGVITSAVKSVRLGKGVGLGYVRQAQAKPGVRLTMASPQGDMTVLVEELPFKP
jgi:folate-binding protein YgfZ